MLKRFYDILGQLSWTSRPICSCCSILKRDDITSN